MLCEGVPLCTKNIKNNNECAPKKMQGPPSTSVGNTQAEDASAGSVRGNTPPLTFAMQLKLLQDKVNKLESRDKVSAPLTWEEIPQFDPGQKTIAINKWTKLIDQRAYFFTMG